MKTKQTTALPMTSYSQPLATSMALKTLRKTSAHIPRTHVRTILDTIIVAIGLSSYSMTSFGQCAAANAGYSIEYSEGPWTGDFGDPNLGQNGLMTKAHSSIVKDGAGQVVAVFSGSTIDERRTAYNAENQCYYYTLLKNVQTNYPQPPGPALQGLISTPLWLKNYVWSGHYPTCGFNFVQDVDRTDYVAVNLDRIPEQDAKSCKAAVDPVNNEPPPCGESSPNPIAYRDGNKWLLEADIKAADIEFSRKYNSNPNTATTSIGANWSTGFESALFFSPPLAGAQTHSKLITALRGGDGSKITFLYANEQYRSTADRKEVIKIIRNGAGAIDGYDFYPADKSLERYSASGKLVSVTDTMGRTTQFTYANGDLVSVTSPSGRGLGFTYLITPDMREGTAIDAPGKVIYTSSGDVAYASSDADPGASGYSVSHVSPPVQYPLAGQLGYVASPEPEDALPVVARSANRLLAVTDPSGNVYGYRYDSLRNLVSVTYPGGAVKSYVFYEGAFPHAMAGIVDEKGVRYTTYTYDAEGRADSESMENGVGNYTMDYSTPNATSVTDPLGSIYTYGFQSINGALKNISQSQPDGSGCMAATSAKTYNPDGTVATAKDFNGIFKAYQYNPVTGLPTKITEASGTALARDTAVQWHAYWKLPTQVDEVTKVTTNVYNGDGEVSCAPGSALIQKDDGTMIAIPVHCSQTVRAKLGGVVDSSVPAQVSSYTYDAAGRMLTSKDSLNQTTTYAYYTATAFTGTNPNATGRTVGDLQSITNAAGHVTQFTQYDKAGRLKQMVDPNGVVTDTAYTPRGWISSTTVTPQGGTARTTSYSYDNAGQLTEVVMPDSTTLAYSYDAAQRLVGVLDAKGNSVTYTLDNMGNRVNEQIKDPQGNLQRNITRVYDALSRLQQITGAAN